MKKNVRIVVVGDSGVGKSTLITTLLKEEFVEKVDHLLGEFTIPSHVTPEKVTTHIIDTSNLPEHKDKLESDLKRANVICVLYSVDNAHTFASIASKWLPYFQSLGLSVPIILVGNKIDVRGDDALNAHLQENIKPIMSDWKEVETCVECSAKTNMNVSEVFYFAQKAVLYPMAPLFDTAESVFTDACADALKRIFNLCDADKDGYMNDAELNEFQTLCFNTPLQSQEIAALKKVLSELDADSVSEEGITEIGIPLVKLTYINMYNPAGFLCLHLMFVQRGRLETTWAVLRKFGYGDDLELAPEFLNPKVSVHGDQTVEVSRAGYEFLEGLFATFDKDGDGALSSDQELQLLFETAPANPFAGFQLAQTASTNKAGYLTKKGFLGMWALQTVLDFKTTQQYFAYLGYNDKTSPVTVTKGRKEAHQLGKIDKRTLKAFVVGAHKSGKSSLLKKALFQTVTGKEPHVATSASQFVVQSVKATTGADGEKFIVLQEIPVENTLAVLGDAKQLVTADVLVFLFDQSDPASFSYISNLMQTFAFGDKVEPVPWVLVGTKTDLAPASAEQQSQSKALAAKVNAKFVATSFVKGDAGDLLTTIVQSALDASPSSLPNQKGGASKKGLARYKWVSLGAITVIAAVVGTGFYFHWDWKEFSENKYVVELRKVFAEIPKKIGK